MQPPLTKGDKKIAFSEVLFAMDDNEKQSSTLPQEHNFLPSSPFILLEMQNTPLPPQEQALLLLDAFKHVHRAFQSFPRGCEGENFLQAEYGLCSRLTVQAFCSHGELCGSYVRIC